MYSYNSSKNSYIQLSESLEIYRVYSEIPLLYSETATTDAEKDFDHIKQLILMYDKILFFTNPMPSDNTAEAHLLNAKKYTEFTFGVSVPNLFAYKENEVGILENRLDELVLFGGTLKTKGVNKNAYIFKLKEQF